jgi:Flp pilus assembly protein TadD/uncharacterized protein YchJ
MMKQRLLVGLLMAQLWPLTLTANQTAPMLVPSAQGNATAGINSTAQPEIRSLMQAGRLAEASREIARQLQKPDPEPTLQLLQCVVQANQNQTDKAIACLSALVKAHPDMLEAYNNLGVLHASLGQHEEAKRWLTLAMQRMPSLWTVHQNLQTLQADLSRKAYARALQAELPLKDTPPRLTMLATSALSNPVKSAQVSPPTMVAAPESPQLLASTPVAAPSSTPQALRKPDAAKPAAARTEAITATKPEFKKAEVSKSETPKPEVLKTESPKAETSKTKGLDEATRQQLQAAVQAWAQAWSSQNMGAYFGAYAADYTPSKWTPRAAWEAERTSRIVGRQFVKVSVSSFSFENKGPKTAVRFNQVYESDNIQSTHRKRLDMVQIDGRWKIVRETVISQ